MLHNHYVLGNIISDIFGYLQVINGKTLPYNYQSIHISNSFH